MQLVKTSYTPVRWGEMDALGHVNNGVYFRYMEQIRIDWLMSCFDMVNEVNTGPVLINAKCDFLRPIKYPNQIEVQMFIDSPGRSSFETYYQIHCLGTEKDGKKTLCAEGSAKVVWVDRITEKSTPLPAVILQQFR